ncbi:UNVERIFIED_CONTAM: hypothetical protein RMT77_015832 [Armadillidium vulgare]
MCIKSVLIFCLLIGIVKTTTNTSKQEEEEEESDEMDPDTKYETVPNCLASRMWWPVCASNGKNYANTDIFECARKKEPGIRIVNDDGPCNSTVERNKSTGSILTSIHLLSSVLTFNYLIYFCFNN